MKGQCCGNCAYFTPLNERTIDGTMIGQCEDAMTYIRAMCDQLSFALEVNVMNVTERGGQECPSFVRDGGE